MQHVTHGRIVHKSDVMNTTIKLIDVFGQFGNQENGHCYTYLPSQQDQPSGWKAEMGNPRGEVSDDLHYCYATWCTSTDWWIAKMLRNPHDPSGGLAVLSVCIGPNRPLEGERAIAMLDNLARFFVIEKHWDDSEAEKALVDQEQDIVFVPCELRSFDMNSPVKDSAYRSYETKEELGCYLSILPQPVYEQFIRVFFVPKQDAVGMHVKSLDGKFPLKRIYAIQYPENCTSSPFKTEIMDDEELTLVYSKAGREPKKVRIKGGVNSDYADIDGTNMRIRSGEEIGLTHDRVIEIVCQDRSGNGIENFRIVNYAQQIPVRIHANKVTVSEADLDKEIKLEINPIGDKFDAIRVVLDKERLDGDVFLVELETKKYKVAFQMNNEDFETNTLMSPSLARNRWGSFDYKIDDKNRTITFKAWPKPQEKTQREVNYFVAEKAPLGERMGDFFKKRRKLILVFLAALLVLCGIYFAIDRLWLNKTNEPTATQTEVVDNTTDGQTAASEQPENEVVEPENKVVKPEVVVESENEVVKPEKVVKPETESVKVEAKPVGSTSEYVQHDVDYLLREDKVWKKDSLQSQTYQTLYDDIAKGRMDKVIAQYESLFGNNDRTNEVFKRIVEGLKVVRASGNQPMLKLASDEMRRLSRGDSIKLAELKTSITIVVKRTRSNQQ